MNNQRQRLPWDNSVVINLGILPFSKWVNRSLLYYAFTAQLAGAKLFVHQSAEITYENINSNNSLSLKLFHLIWLMKYEVRVATNS